MNIQEIENTIMELENSNATFDSCEKLASLYVVRDHLLQNNKSQDTDDIIKEYNDILPEYSNYCNLKRDFQFGKVDNKCVLKSLCNVCDEINEFIKILYDSVDIVEEKEILNTKLSIKSGL